MATERRGVLSLERLLQQRPPEGSFQQLGRHPNLLRLLAISIEPSSGDYCLVTEFAGKGSLAGVSSNFAEEEDKMNLLVQLQVARQICDGMVHCRCLRWCIGTWRRGAGTRRVGPGV